MGARQITRSQQGVRAEARRRIAERARKAETALTDYLQAGEQIEAARGLIAVHETSQRKALADLAEVLGPDQAAAAAGVGVREVKQVVAGARTRPRRDSHSTSSDGEPDSGVTTSLLS